MKVTLRTDVLTNNNKAAEFNRDLFTSSRTLVINLMSSPGAGKTTLLEETVRALRENIVLALLKVTLRLSGMQTGLGRWGQKLFKLIPKAAAILMQEW